MNTNSAAESAEAAGCRKKVDASLNGLRFTEGDREHELSNEVTGESIRLRRGQVRDLLKLLHLAAGAD